MDPSASESLLSFKRCPMIELRSSKKLTMSSLAKMQSSNRLIWLEVDILEKLKRMLKTGEELWERTPKLTSRFNSTLNLLKTQGLFIKWCNVRIKWKWQRKIALVVMRNLSKRKVGFFQALVLAHPNQQVKKPKPQRNQMLTPHNFSKPRKCLKHPTWKNETPKKRIHLYQ